MSLNSYYDFDKKISMGKRVIQSQIWFDLPKIQTKIYLYICYSEAPEPDIPQNP